MLAGACFTRLWRCGWTCTDQEGGGQLYVRGELVFVLEMMVVINTKTVVAAVSTTTRWNL